MSQPASARRWVKTNDLRILATPHCAIVQCGVFWILVSPLTFAGMGKTVSSWVNLSQSRILCDGNVLFDYDFDEGWWRDWQKMLQPVLRIWMTGMDVTVHALSRACTVSLRKSHSNALRVRFSSFNSGFVQKARKHLAFQVGLYCNGMGRIICNRNWKVVAPMPSMPF